MSYHPSHVISHYGHYSVCDNCGIVVFPDGAPDLDSACEFGTLKTTTWEMIAAFRGMRTLYTKVERRTAAIHLLTNRREYNSVHNPPKPPT